MLAGIDDTSNTRKLQFIAGGLAALGIFLVLFTVWFWRSSRADHGALGPLELMGARRWRKAPMNEQITKLAEVRPAGAMALAGSDRPAVNLAELVAGHHSSTPDRHGGGFSDLVDGEPQSLIGPIDDPWVEEIGGVMPVRTDEAASSNDPAAEPEILVPLDDVHHDAGPAELTNEPGSLASAAASAPEVVAASAVGDGVADPSLEAVDESERLAANPVESAPLGVGDHAEPSVLVESEDIAEPDVAGAEPEVAGAEPEVAGAEPEVAEVARPETAEVAPKEPRVVRSEVSEIEPADVEAFERNADEAALTPVGVADGVAGITGDEAVNDTAGSVDDEVASSKASVLQPVSGIPRSDSGGSVTDSLPRPRWWRLRR